MRRNKYRRRPFGRRRKSPETIFWIVLMLALGLLGAGFWVHSTLFPSGGAALETGREQALPEKAEPEEETETALWVPKEPDTHTSILLLGLDNYGMGDAIMIISYDMETYESSLISIKRDTYVSGQTWALKDSGQDHLAWAHNRGMGEDNDFQAGAEMTAATVEELLGIDLHAYASITFDGFVELVDLIGGVSIDVPPGFAERDGQTLAPGRRQLSGEEALIYARHRRNPRIPEPGSTSQDGDRVRRNQRLLKAILDQAKTLETDELLAVIDQLESKLFTSLDGWDILELFNLMYNRDPDDIETVVLPGEGEMVDQERIDSEIYYFFLDFEETDMILQELGLK